MTESGSSAWGTEALRRCGAACFFPPSGDDALYLPQCEAAREMGRAIARQREARRSCGLKHRTGTRRHSKQAHQHIRAWLGLATRVLWPASFFKRGAIRCPPVSAATSASPERRAARRSTRSSVSSVGQQKDGGGAARTRGKRERLLLLLLLADGCEGKAGVRAY